MNRYAAKHHVPISGRMFTPGEMIDVEIPEDKLYRLLRLKAIVPVACTAPVFPDETIASSSHDGLMDASDNYADQLDTMGCEPSGDPQDPAGEEEPDAEEEAPEIDVMDGILAPEADADDTPKSKKTTKGRKKA